MTTGISTEIKEKVILTANALFEERHRETFPTVDEVRRLAGVDMNAASVIMREWRKQQTSQAGKIAITIPEKVQGAFQAALTTAWTEAQDMANESLKSAQNAWDDERRQEEQLRSEMAQAFEEQAREIEAGKGREEKAAQHLKELGEKLNAQALQIADLTKDLATVTTKKEVFEQQVKDAKGRIEELKAEVAELKAENKGLVQKLSDELDSYRKKTVRKKPAAKAKVGQKA